MKKRNHSSRLSDTNLRRRLLKISAIAPAFSLLAQGNASKANVADPFAEVVEGKALNFPRDHGAHPDYRTEWWYLTGWLDQGTRSLGFQVTFFRSRTVHSRSNPSRFSASQLMFAHVAIASPEQPGFAHDQRSARAGFGYASYATDSTDLRIGDWRLWQTDADRYECLVRARDFLLRLSMDAAAPVWEQGKGGYSQKGPMPTQASYYYSRPQLAIRAELQWAKKPSQAAMPKAEQFTGLGWLDHEWSSQILDPQASGWDWIGLNLLNGDALMAFQIRKSSKPLVNNGDKQIGSARGRAEVREAVLWRHARMRRADQSSRDFSDSIGFGALRWWRSTRTGVSYPVEMAITFGERTLKLIPLFDDQELDSRQSTGTLYWEGAVRVLEQGAVIGRGYLELTGYGDRLRL